MTAFFVAFATFGNFLEGILAVWLASLPDESFRLALGNFDDGIFFLAVENLLDAIFAKKISF